MGYFLFKPIFRAFCSVCDFVIYTKPVAVINKLKITTRYFRKMKETILTSEMLLTLAKSKKSYSDIIRSPFNIKMIKLIGQSFN